MSGCIVWLFSQEGRAALGAVPGNVREPEGPVRRAVRADALPPDRGRRLQKG
jgi:hypothetical protein